MNYPNSYKKANARSGAAVRKVSNIPKCHTRNDFSFCDGPSSYEFFDQPNSTDKQKEPDNQPNSTDKQKNINFSELPDVTQSLVPKIAPMEYSENNYKYNMLDNLGSLGDNIIARHMKHVSNKNREAIDNFARQNKNTNINYLKGELDEHANVAWWDDDDLEQEFN